jgi:hypothetical protein
MKKILSSQVIDVPENGKYSLSHGACELPDPRPLVEEGGGRHGGSLLLTEKVANLAVSIVPSNANAHFGPTVKVEIKSRIIRVSGPRGTLQKEFKHLNLDVQLVNKSKLRVDVWFANRKQSACVRTISSIIENLIKGVTTVRKMPRVKQQN